MEKNNNNKPLKNQTKHKNDKFIEKYKTSFLSFFYEPEELYYTYRYPK